MSAVTRWYRVFGTNDADPDPAVLLELLRCLEPNLTAKFSGDDQGWFRAVFSADAEEPPLILERYLAIEEGIRPQIMTWIAWLETQEKQPNRDTLMDHLVATRQMYTLHVDENDAEEPSWSEGLCRALCECLAQIVAGVYQVDQHGFFATDGRVLLMESSPPALA